MGMDNRTDIDTTLREFFAPKPEVKNPDSNSRKPNGDLNSKVPSADQVEADLSAIYHIESAANKAALQIADDNAQKLIDKALDQGFTTGEDLGTDTKH